MQKLRLDHSVPGVEAALAEGAIVSEGAVLRLLWQRVSRRSALLHILDVLEASGMDFIPGRADAIAAWEDMHDESSDTPPTAGAMMDGGCGPGGRVELADGFDPLLQRNDTFVNHVFLVAVAAEASRPPAGAPGAVLPRTGVRAVPAGGGIRRPHLHIATELCDRFGRKDGSPTGPPVAMRAYRYRGVVAPLLVWVQTARGLAACAVRHPRANGIGHAPAAGAPYVPARAGVPTPAVRADGA